LAKNAPDASVCTFLIVIPLRWGGAEYPKALTLSNSPKGQQSTGLQPERNRVAPFFDRAGTAIAPIAQIPEVDVLWVTGV
jgi:hypothetical protein